MCPPAGPAHAQLPPELWTLVFFWATHSPVRDISSLLTVPLFDGIAHREDEVQVREALRIKITLALVCRQWRALSEQYLYEDIRIRHGKCISADMLERSREACPQGHGVGRHVRRIVLPQLQNHDRSTRHSRHWADRDTSRIIKCCPSLLVLSRYHNILVKEDDNNEVQNEEEENPMLESECCSIHDPPLPTMRRLDWCNGIADDPWHPTICAVPSAVWSAQLLEVLSLAGENYFWGPAELQSFAAGERGTILLPNLHTLRVGSIYAFGVPGISNYTLTLPALRRIILDRGEALHRLVECVFASPPSLSTSLPDEDGNIPPVTSLEIGTPHWRFSRSDYTSTLIRHYPTAESLHYPIFFVRPLRWRRLRDNGLSYGPADTHRVFSNIRRVALHAQPNPELTYLEGNTADAVWSHLYAHARALLGSTSPTLLESRLPGIRLVTLYGHFWTPFLEDMRFHVILDLARERGAEIRAEIPSVASALEDTLFSYGTDLIYDWVRGL